VEESLDKAQEKGNLKKREKVAAACSARHAHRASGPIVSVFVTNLFVFWGASSQIKEKVALSDKKVVIALNDYTLTLAAANAFKRRYYKVRSSEAGFARPRPSRFPVVALFHGAAMGSRRSKWQAFWTPWTFTSMTRSNTSFNSTVTSPCRSAPAAMPLPSFFSEGHAMMAPTPTVAAGMQAEAVVAKSIGTVFEASQLIDASAEKAGPFAPTPSRLPEAVSRAAVADAKCLCAGPLLQGQRDCLCGSPSL
jgi:hypothetical protein